MLYKLPSNLVPIQNVLALNLYNVITRAYVTDLRATLIEDIKVCMVPPLRKIGQMSIE